MSTVSTGPMTAEEFIARPDMRGFELINGEPVELTTSVTSMFVGSRLGGLLDQFCREHDAGVTLSSDAAIRCFPDEPHTVRKPDVAFLSKKQLSQAVWNAPYCPVVPDLVVEAVSPHDLSVDLAIKIEMYRSAGVKLIWIIWPDARVANVERIDGSMTKLHASDFLDGEDVLPGFRVRLEDVLPPQVSGVNR